jgi:hypothetical protein
MPPDKGVQTLTGMLYLIEVATAQRHLGLMVNHRRIPCYYAHEYEEVVRELIPGSFVEVEGRATLDERGEVQQIEEIFDVRPVQLVSLYWNKVIHGNRCFYLRNKIQIRVDFRDGLWIHEYEPLEILSYAASRAESLNAFRMDFAACWDLVAQEDDMNLTTDAQKLKRKLLSLIEKVENLS